MEAADVVSFRVYERLGMTIAVYLIALVSMGIFAWKGAKMDINSRVSGHGLDGQIVMTISVPVLIFVTVIFYSWANMANPISVANSKAPIFIGLGGNESRTRGYFEQLFTSFLLDQRRQSASQAEATLIFDLALKLEKLRLDPAFEPDLFTRNRPFVEISRLIEAAHEKIQ